MAELLDVGLATPICLFKTRREYVHVGSGAASMRHTVFHKQIGVAIPDWFDAGLTG